ncbi:MAG TPA: hypothetical protein VLD67_00655 [Vicinamibacterales bacterium]|nr:hypothetical protein [Vicinamibacterales bacterium]
MRIFVLAAAIAIGHGSSAQAQQRHPPEPIVQIGVFSSNADGRNVASAFDTEPDLSSIVYVGRTVCHLGAGYRQPPADATGAWRFSGRMISKTPEEAVVQVTWQRLVENGNPANAGEISVQLTLLAGERVVLDPVAPVYESSCEAITAAFEARYMPRLSGSRTRMFGVGAGSAVSGGGSASAGTGLASGGAGAAVRRHRDETRLFDIHLWLVHGFPGREDSVVHSVLRVTEQGGEFAFAPVAVETPTGPATLQVTGIIELPGGSRFVFSTNRTIRFGRSGQPPRDPAPARAGSSRIVDRLPGPDEVLSFEMPPVQLNDGQTLPDQFSVRVRVRPVDSR